MRRKIIPVDSLGITQIAIFDDMHENVQRQMNEFFAELGLAASEIQFEQYIRYKDKDGEARTYAVIRYQQKNPA